MRQEVMKRESSAARLLSSGCPVHALANEIRQACRRIYLLYQKIAIATKTTVMIHKTMSLLRFFSSAIVRQYSTTLFHLQVFSRNPSRLKRANRLVSLVTYTPWRSAIPVRRKLNQQAPSYHEENRVANSLACPMVTV